MLVMSIPEINYTILHKWRDFKLEVWEKEKRFSFWWDINNLNVEPLLIFSVKWGNHQDF